MVGFIIIFYPNSKESNLELGYFDNIIYFMNED